MYKYTHLVQFILYFDTFHNTIERDRMGPMAKCQPRCDIHTLDI